MEIHAMTAVEIADLLTNGRISSVEAVESCLRHIAARDEVLGSFVTVMAAEALAAAEQSDQRRREGRLRSQWDGVPVAVKDNLALAGVRMTCGSKMLEDYIPPEDAHVIALLKDQGMPIIGKTNMDEFAMGSSTEFSALKTTRNPWDVDRVPGGSSGGSAASVASGQAPWALGSDTGGSVREPASFCGVVGVKPTYGRVSRRGLTAYASSLDQVGTFAQTVIDGAALLQAIAGFDPKDSTSLDLTVPNWVQTLGDGVAGMRIGILPEINGEAVDEDVQGSQRQAAAVLTEAGATVETISIPFLDKAIETYYLIATAEASSNLARYDGVRYGLRVDGVDATDMFRKSRSAGFGPEVKRRIMLGTYVLSAGYYDAYYKKAQQVRRLLADGFKQAFSRVDLLLTPTTAATAFRFGEKQDPLTMYQTDIFTVPANLAGLPALSLPFGRCAAGMPIGLQLTAAPLREDLMFRGAAVLETFESERRMPYVTV